MAPVKIGMRFPVAILFANSITITLAAASVCLRIWSQALRKVSLQGSDYFICFSWVLAIRNHCTHRLSLTMRYSCSILVSLFAPTSVCAR